MFEYIKGPLIESNPTVAVIDANGVGYRLFLPFNQFLQLPSIGEIVTLYVCHIVREDSQKLYGFLTKEVRELFKHLIDISGVGPKTALALVGHIELDAFCAAIHQSNTQLISKIPGIGKKTAERLVIEMKDKIKKGPSYSLGSSLPALEPLKEEGVVADAVSALLNLGYQTLQAQKAVQKALSSLSEEEGKEPALGQLITAALRVI